MKVTSAEYPEVEYTYELEPGALEALWRVFFVGPTGVELDGAIYRRVATVERIAIHLFLETDQPNMSDRLQLRFSRGKVRAVRSPKRWAVTPSGSAKMELRKPPKLSLADAAKLLRANSLISAFLKAKTRATFRGFAHSRFQVSVDRMIPFVPGQPREYGSPFVHFECEVVRDWHPRILEHAAFFQEELMPYLRRIHRSKKDQARLREPHRTGIRTADDLRTYAWTVRRHLLHLLPAFPAPPS